MDDTDVLQMDVEEIQFRALSIGIGLGQLKPQNSKAPPKRVSYPETRPLNGRSVTQPSLSPSRKAKSIPVVYSDLTPAKKSNIGSNPRAEFDRSELANNPYLTAPQPELRESAQRRPTFIKSLVSMVGLPFSLMVRLVSIKWLRMERLLTHFVDCAIVLATLLVVGLGVSYFMFGSEMSFTSFVHQSISDWTARFSTLEAFGIFYLAVGLYWLTFKVMVGKTLGKVLVER